MNVLVWGAGREGRGFLADVFAPCADVHMIDTDRTLIERLQAADSYRLLLRPADGSMGERRVEGCSAWHADNPAVDGLVATADAIALCVYLEDMPEAVRRMVPGLLQRRQDAPDRPLDLFICANAIHYGPTLRDLLRAAMPESAHGWLDHAVGVVETLVRRTCVLPSPAEADGDPLAVMTNAYPVLTIDGTAVKGRYAGVDFFDPVEDMRMEEHRKIYTYNLLHVTYAYMGYPKGYEYINQSWDDRTIRTMSEAVYRESAAALTAHYGLDPAAMREYENTMWSYVVNPAMPDPVLRTGCDPIRKLSRDERIIGPAMLCLDHGIQPDAIALVAAHAFRYDHPGDPAARRLRVDVEANGIRACVERYSGVPADSELARLIIRAYEAL